MGKLLALVLFSLSAFARPALADCKLQVLSELPVTMIGFRPIVTAQINGKDAKFVADSGAFFSTITRANAEAYGLNLRPAPFGFVLQGVTGEASVEIGVAHDFALSNFKVRNVEFLVGGSEVGAHTVGLLGQNVFHLGDVEYDLANGAIRLFRPKDCGRATLAYWIKPAAAVSEVSIASTTSFEPHTIGDVVINGVRLRATFDTGASTSMLTLRAAARAGVRTTSKGVVPGGRSGGVGRRTIDTWIAPIKSFKIGDEEIKDTHLRIADLELQNSDMLLGADFFLSHRIYVATSQSKLYLTYNGGAVFHLFNQPVVATASGSAVGPPAASANPQVTQPGDHSADEPTDASGFARRGMAYVSRHDYDQGLADLTRAIELAPTEPQYFADRARARLANGQPLLAKADLDQVLKLQPDDLTSRALRAELDLARSDRAQAMEDLQAVDKLAAKQDDLRFTLARLYEVAENLSMAVTQYGLWIAAHDDDYRMAQARNGRCWARALLDQELDKALADCNAAIRSARNIASFLDSRGLVYLRRGEPDKAIADYNAALKLNPKLAWSLYGRGLAEQRKGLTAQGDADLAAAVAIAPRLPGNAERHGLRPLEPAASPPHQLGTI